MACMICSAVDVSVKTCERARPAWAVPCGMLLVCYCAPESFGQNGGVTERIRQPVDVGSDLIAGAAFIGDDRESPSGHCLDNHLTGGLGFV